MSLKITKDRSNIDTVELEESIEAFIENIHKGLNSIGGLPKSANSAKDTLHEWDSSYKKYNIIMNEIATIKDYESLFY